MTKHANDACIDCDIEEWEESAQEKQKGGGSIFVLALSVLCLVSACAMMVIFGAAQEKILSQAVADHSALAAAHSVFINGVGEEESCARAAHVAQENGRKIRECLFEGGSVKVGIESRSAFFFQWVVYSRAGYGASYE